MDESLKISITGDASGLEKASQQAASALNKIDKSATQTNTTLAGLPKVSAQISTASQKMATSAATAGGAISKLKISLADLQDKLKAKQQLLITERDLSRIRQYQSEIAVLKTEIATVSKITIGDAGASKLISGAGAAFSAVRKLAYVIPGVGIAGILAFATEPITKYISALFNTETEAEKVKKVLGKVFEEANKKAGENVAKLQLVYGATQDLTRSQGDRLKSIQELKNTYPDTFANFTNEAILAGKATDAYNLLSDSIIKTARAQAGAAAVGDLEAERLKVVQDIAKAKADFNKTISGITKDIVVKQPITRESTTPDKIITVAEQQRHATQLLNEELQKQGKALLDIHSREQIIIDATQDFSEGSKFAAGSINELQEKLKGLKAQFEGLSAVNRTGAIGQGLINQIKDIEAQIGKASGLIKPPKIKEDKSLEKILEERKKILLEFVKDFETIKIPFPELSKPLESFDIKGIDLIKELRGKLQDAALKLAPVKFDIPIIPLPTVQGLEAIKTIPLKIQASIQVVIDAADAQAKAQAQIQKTIEGFNQSLTSVVQNSFANVGESIGAALAGGSFDNVFKTIVGSAGDFLQQLGKILIQVGVKLELFKEALYTWAIAHPALAVAAGVGLIAAGAFIKNTVLPKPKGFAKGGWVPGQGSGDTVHAMLTPGEFVVTKDKAPFIASLLKALGSGIKLPKISDGKFHFATGGFVPSIDQRSPLSTINNIIKPAQNSVIMPQGDWKIRGKDLVFVMAQTQKSQGRTT